MNDELAKGSQCRHSRLKIVFLNSSLFILFALSAAMCSYNRQKLLHMVHIACCWENASQVMDSMIWKYMPASGGNTPWDITGRITRYDYHSARGESGCPDGGDYYVDFNSPYHPGFRIPGTGMKSVAYRINRCSVHGYFPEPPDFADIQKNPYDTPELGVRLEILALFWLILTIVTALLIAGYNIWLSACSLRNS